MAEFDFSKLPSKQKAAGFDFSKLPSKQKAAGFDFSKLPSKQGLMSQVKKFFGDIGTITENPALSYGTYVNQFVSPGQSLPPIPAKALSDFDLQQARSEQILRENPALTTATLLKGAVAPMLPKGMASPELTPKQAELAMRLGVETPNTSIPAVMGNVAKSAYRGAFNLMVPATPAQAVAYPILGKALPAATSAIKQAFPGATATIGRVLATPIQDLFKKLPKVPSLSPTLPSAPSSFPGSKDLSSEATYARSKMDIASLKANDRAIRFEQSLRNLQETFGYSPEEMVKIEAMARKNMPPVQPVIEPSVPPEPDLSGMSNEALYARNEETLAKLQANYREGTNISALAPQSIESGVPKIDLPSTPPPIPKEMSLARVAQAHFAAGGESTLKRTPSGADFAKKLVAHDADSENLGSFFKEKFIPKLQALPPEQLPFLEGYVKSGGKVTEGMTPTALEAAEAIRATTRGSGRYFEAFSKKYKVLVDDPKMPGEIQARYGSMLPQNIDIATPQGVVSLQKELRAKGFVQDKVDEITMGLQGKRFFKRRANYWPQQIDHTTLATPEGRAKEIANLTPQMRGDARAATALVDEIIEAHEPSPSSFLDVIAINKRLKEELTKTRKFTFVNTIKDPIKLFDNFYSGLGRSLADRVHFGPNLEGYDEALKRIRRLDGKRAFEIAKAIGGRMMGAGRVTEGQAALTNAIKSFEVVTKMNVGSTIVNAPQGVVNPYLYTGDLGVVKRGWGQARTEAGKRFARQLGYLDKPLSDSYMSITTGETPLIEAGPSLGKKYLKTTGFSYTELANKQVASVIGREYTKNKLVPAFLKGDRSQNMIKELTKLGIDPKALALRGRLTNIELRRAAKVFAKRRTEFVNDALSMPIFSQTPEGSLFYMYTTFSHQQAALFWNKIKDGGALKAGVPLAARLAVVAAVVGVPVAKLRSVINLRFLTEPKRKRTDSLAMDLMKDWVQGFTAVGGLGRMSDLIASAQYPGGALGSVAGPLMTDVGDIGGTITKPQQIPEQTVRRLPYIGAPLRNLLRWAGVFGKRKRSIFETK